MRICEINLSGNDNTYKSSIDNVFIKAEQRAIELDIDIAQAAE